MPPGDGPIRYRCEVPGCQDQGNMSGEVDEQGVVHWYCKNHDRLLLVAESGHTCGEGPPRPPQLMPDPCGRPATVKYTDPFGLLVFYWCESCRRKYHPTRAEREADEKAQAEAASRKQRSEEFWDTLTAPIVLLIRIGVAVGVAVVAIYALVAFIHWCWRSS